MQPDSVANVEPDDEPDSQPECGADVQPDHWNADSVTIVEPDIADGQPDGQPFAEPDG